MTNHKGVTTLATDRCKGCGLCIISCPLHILEFQKNCVNVKGYLPVFVNAPEDCIGCGNCAIMCPDSVITVHRFDIDRRKEHA